MLNHDEKDKFPADLEELIINPKILGNAAPDEWYYYLKNKGYDLLPLGKGNHVNIPYKEGGGFRIHWGGDRIFSYHPPNRSHHGEAYWKLSSGATGIKRYELNGDLKPEGKEQVE